MPARREKRLDATVEAYRKHVGQFGQVRVGGRDQAAIQRGVTNKEEATGPVYEYDRGPESPGMGTLANSGGIRKVEN